jgi:F0F1-type ATP synthase membrane subunit b/b'
MPPKVGRPKKSDSEGTKEQIAKRKYMRDYNAKILNDIQELSKMELECVKELEQIKKEKKELEKQYKKSLAMLEKANKQAEDILKEKTKK